MNKYKKWGFFFRILMWVVSLGIALVIFLPMLQHKLKTSTQLAMDIYSTDTLDGLNWILKNDKKILTQSGKANWIFVNDASDLTDDLMAAVDQNVFIGEMLFSQFGGDVTKHYFLEQMFDSKFSGFMGMTVEDLADVEAIPSQIIEKYQVATGQAWPYFGEGIILAGEKDILVLLEGEDYTGSMLLETDSDAFPYSGFFEVLSDAPSMTSTFRIPVLASGEEKLKALGLSPEFGASYRLNNQLYDGLYFSGQFSAIEVSVPTAYEGMPALMQHKGLYDERFNESLYWKWYYPMISAVLNQGTHRRYDLRFDNINDNKFKVVGQEIYQVIDGEQKPFFIKGINLGAALPGKNFTEFPMDKGVYRKWLEQMATLNINTIRVYTLLPPSFYQALYEFNEAREHPIYLLQEIWPEEYPEDHNYLGQAYNTIYRQEIEYAVHAIHGNINIPKRSYRSYGLYHYDVSPYLIAYLVGREMEAQEVRATDALNMGYVFQGQYFYSLTGATPTEAWLAASCDYALKIEDTFYGDAPLAAIVSWPTLDPKSHDSEWSILTRKENKFNDNTVVDINNIGIHEDKVSGFFGAYHIYSNYPDFMNNELAYDDYEDQYGRFRYGGYLQEFMAGHSKYPAVVAEYGLSTSQVTAHYSPDGYNHGGLSEEAQAKGIIRMTEAIVHEGYAGAVIFEWMDEWAKKTWTTEPYMIPYNQNPFWHNVLDPEQNYGLLAIESLEPQYESNGPIALGQNTAYIYIKIDEREFDSKTISLTIDTVNNGDHVEEFLLRVGTSSELLVNPAYNWVNGYYHAVESDLEDYEHLIQMTNGENTSMYGVVTPARHIDLSVLNYGDFRNPRNTVTYDGRYWTVRMPYGLLGISDPSQNYALSDEERKVPILRDQIKVEALDRISIGITGDNKVYDFKLDTWYNPDYKMRFKKGFEQIGAYFKELKE